MDKEKIDKEKNWNDDRSQQIKEKLKAGGLARTSSILGAASLPLSWMIFGVLVAILAIVLSAVGFATDKAPNKFKKRCLRTGLFCGIITIILHTVFGIMILMTNARLSQSSKTTSQMSPEAVQQIIQQAEVRNTKTSSGNVPTAVENTLEQLREKLSLIHI